MALRPEAFLTGLEPEQGNFGFKARLELWLHLNEQGLMDAGFGDYSKAFETE